MEKIKTPEGRKPKKQELNEMINDLTWGRQLQALDYALADFYNAPIHVNFNKLAHQLTPTAAYDSKWFFQRFKVTSEEQRTAIKFAIKRQWDKAHNMQEKFEILYASHQVLPDIWAEAVDVDPEKQREDKNNEIFRVTSEDWRAVASETEAKPGLYRYVQLIGVDERLARHYVKITPDIWKKLTKDLKNPLAANDLLDLADEASKAGELNYLIDRYKLPYPKFTIRLRDWKMVAAVEDNKEITSWFGRIERVNKYKNLIIVD